MFSNMESKKPQTPKLRVLDGNPRMKCVKHVEFTIKTPKSPCVQYLPISFDP